MTQPLISQDLLKISFCHPSFFITTGIIYYISFKTYHQLYSRETKRRLGDHFAEHLPTSRMKDFSFSMARHFNSNAWDNDILEHRNNEVTKLKELSQLSNPREWRSCFDIYYINHFRFQWVSLPTASEALYLKRPASLETSTMFTITTEVHCTMY